MSCTITNTEQTNDLSISQQIEQPINKKLEAKRIEEESKYLGYVRPARMQNIDDLYHRR